MALAPRRHLFGKQSGDWTGSIDSNDFLKVAKNATLWVFLTETGNDRITDLQNSAGSAITEIATDSNGTIPEFYGPEDIQRVWVGQPGGTIRTLLVATDLHDDIDTLDAALDAVEIATGVQVVNGVEPVDGEVTLGPEDLAPSGAIASDVTALQAIVGTRVLQVSGAYPPRPSAAVWAWFIGSVDPGANALDGDLWFQPETA